VDPTDVIVGDPGVLTASFPAAASLIADFTQEPL